MKPFKIIKYPRTRIATKDVCAIGLKKHHVAAILEMDVSDAREKIKKYRHEKGEASFTAWLVKAISLAIKEHQLVSAYGKGKRKTFLFDHVNVSILVEKDLDNQKVPIPLIIEKAEERSVESITRQINDAKNSILTDKDIVLRQRSGYAERLYYHLPGFIRREIWKYLLRHPTLAFRKMGNVAITSVGMKGGVNGWFIPVSVHPVCFGISTVAKKPVVVNDEIAIREILNMTILLDHDVIDGAPMARFIHDLSGLMETGAGL